MHDVFPKARFRDCIKMTEKCGHQAQLRIMRKQWIEQTKPGYVSQQDEDLDNVDGLEVLGALEREQRSCNPLSMIWLSCSERSCS